MIKARVTVTLKNGVLDPQGKAIEGALHALDFAGVGKVRQGKVFDVELDAKDANERTTNVIELQNADAAEVQATLAHPS